MNFDIDERFLTIKKGAYTGKYEELKIYNLYKELSGSLSLLENDKNLYAISRYEFKTMKLESAKFTINISQLPFSDNESFTRLYDIKRISNNSNELPDRRELDLSPSYLERELDQNDSYIYRIKNYDKDSFKSRVKYIKNDIVTTFKHLGDMFNMDIGISLEDDVLAEELINPYRIILYSKKRLIMEYITDETITDNYLIINDYLSDPKSVTVFRKNKETGKRYLEYKYEYELDLHIKNPLLNHRIISYNDVPTFIHYDKLGHITDYDGNDVSLFIKDATDIINFYPATYRFNRDHIFGTNLFYFDRYITSGGLLVDKFERVLYRKIDD